MTEEYTVAELSLPELDILWLTAGLSCDGDTVAMTGASNPSIEDLVLGVIPGVPKVRLHNAVLAYRKAVEADPAKEL